MKKDINQLRIFLKNNLFVILIFISGFLYTQDNKLSNLSDRVMLISTYIASDEFKEKLASHDHKTLVDIIYERSLGICENDISEALLTAALATLPYKKVPFVFPLINERADGTIFNMPDSTFKKKVSNLPSVLFFDSPASSFGDKDKLSHFFGNAFLSYNVELFNLSKFLSILVELFEESFKLDGSVSTRDLLIGNLGELYGRTLSEYENRLPSEYLNYYKLFFIKFIY